MQILMGERIETKVASSHRFIDKTFSDAEIVKEMIGVYVVVPSDNFFIEPAALVHHQYHIDWEDDRDDWMLFDEICDF